MRVPWRKMQAASTPRRSSCKCPGRTRCIVKPLHSGRAPSSVLEDALLHPLPLHRNGSQRFMKQGQNWCVKTPNKAASLFADHLDAVADDVPAHQRLLLAGRQLLRVLHLVSLLRHRRLGRVGREPLCPPRACVPAARQLPSVIAQSASPDERNATTVCIPTLLKRLQDACMPPFPEASTEAI